MCAAPVETITRPYAGEASPSLRSSEAFNDLRVFFEAQKQEWIKSKYVPSRFAAGSEEAEAYIDGFLNRAKGLDERVEKVIEVFARDIGQGANGVIGEYDFRDCLGSFWWLATNEEVDQNEFFRRAHFTHVIHSLLEDFGPKKTLAQGIGGVHFTNSDLKVLKDKKWYDHVDFFGELMSMLLTKVRVKAQRGESGPEKVDEQEDGAKAYLRKWYEAKQNSPEFALLVDGNVSLGEMEWGMIFATNRYARYYRGIEGELSQWLGRLYSPLSRSLLGAFVKGMKDAGISELPRDEQITLRAATKMFCYAIDSSRNSSRNTVFTPDVGRAFFERVPMYQLSEQDRWLSNELLTGYLIAKLGPPFFEESLSKDANSTLKGFTHADIEHYREGLLAGVDTKGVLTSMINDLFHKQGDEDRDYFGDRDKILQRKRQLVDRLRDWYRQATHPGDGVFVSFGISDDVPFVDEETGNVRIQAQSHSHSEHIFPDSDEVDAQLLQISFERIMPHTYHKYAAQELPERKAA